MYDWYWYEVSVGMRKLGINYHDKQIAKASCFVKIRLRYPQSDARTDGKNPGFLPFQNEVTCRSASKIGLRRGQDTFCGRNNFSVYLFNVNQS